MPSATETQAIYDAYAAIGRTPDAEGLAYWSSLFDANVPYETIANEFNKSVEIVLAQEAAAQPKSIQDMSQQQVIDYLSAAPTTQDLSWTPGTGFSDMPDAPSGNLFGYSDTTGQGVSGIYETYNPYAETGSGDPTMTDAQRLTGYQVPLTQAFYPTEGQYGYYVGNYDLNGNLTDVTFQKAEEHKGWFGENIDWIAPALIGGAALLGSGGLSGLFNGAGAGTLGAEAAVDFGALTGANSGTIAGINATGFGASQVAATAFNNALANGASPEVANMAADVAAALEGSGLSTADILASANAVAADTMSLGAVDAAGNIIGGGGSLTIDAGAGAGGAVSGLDTTGLDSLINDLTNTDLIEAETSITDSGGTDTTTGGTDTTTGGTDTTTGGTDTTTGGTDTTTGGTDTTTGGTDTTTGGTGTTTGGTGTTTGGTNLTNPSTFTDFLKKLLPLQGLQNVNVSGLLGGALQAAGAKSIYDRLSGLGPQIRDAYTALGQDVRGQYGNISQGIQGNLGGLFSAAQQAGLGAYANAANYNMDTARQQQYDLMLATMADKRAQEQASLEARRIAQGLGGLQSFNQANSFQYTDPITGTTQTIGADPAMVAYQKGIQQANLQAFTAADQQALDKYKAFLSAGQQQAAQAQNLQNQWINPLLTGVGAYQTLGSTGLQGWGTAEKAAADAYAKMVQGVTGGVSQGLTGTNTNNVLSGLWDYFTNSNTGGLPNTGTVTAETWT